MVKVKFVKTTGIIGRLIAWFTWSKFNHVELYASGHWYTAQYGNGVTKSRFHKYKFMKEEVFELKYHTRDQLSDMIQFLEEQIGKDYDYWGIFGFLVRRDVQRRSKWFCSELIAEALNRIGFDIDETYKMSPEKLYQIVKAKCD